MSSDSRKISRRPAFRCGITPCDDQPYTVLGDTLNNSAASPTLKNFTGRSSCKCVMCVILPSHLACIVLLTLQLNLTASQFPHLFPRPMAPGLQETGRLLPILQIQIIHSSLCRCVGSVGCSPYLSIREISMRTLCRCLHTLHAYMPTHVDLLLAVVARALPEPLPAPTRFPDMWSPGCPASSEFRDRITTWQMR